MSDTENLYDNLTPETMRSMLKQQAVELQESVKAHSESQRKLQDAQARAQKAPSTYVTVSDCTNLNPPKLELTTNEAISEFLHDDENRYLVNVEQAKTVDGVKPQVVPLLSCIDPTVQETWALLCLLGVSKTQNFTETLVRTYMKKCMKELESDMVTKVKVALETLVLKLDPAQSGRSCVSNFTLKAITLLRQAGGYQFVRDTVEGQKLMISQLRAKLGSNSLKVLVDNKTQPRPSNIGRSNVLIV